ncbi:MAG: 4Fe-4S binding protein [Propionibacteriaceae bacterium]|nr:4Fe-4S binding protein [Micropruina sp.]HBX79660.1 ferredoxin [Propionibacteriaceae bacterium]HBY23718.1 ferredoxin [Propionibacteriaceae bacterium]
MTEHKAPRRMGPTRAQLRLRGMKRLRISRGFVQLAFVALIVTAGVRHQLVKVDAPSVDALCPFGGVETLITWITTGELISKIHPSNLILALVVLIATLLVGNLFCGWVCPFGAVQDALTWVRRRLHLPTVTLPASLDRGLRWGRFVVLAIVLYFSVTSAKLWFAGFDPYLTLFSFHWLFEFDLAAMWVPLTILALILGASLVVDRFWCRYLCPLGATFAVVGHLSVFRIRRSSNACTDCTLCDRPCPVGIEPSNAAPLASTDCIGCLDCVAACPVKGALKFDGPVVLGMPLRKDVEVASAPRRSGTKVPS